MKTGGYEAEFGQSTGGVVNVVTKSGTNDAARQRCSATSGPTGSRAAYDQVTTVERHGQHRRDTQRATPASRPAARSCTNRCSSSARSIRSGRRTTFIAPEGFPLRSLGEVDRDRRIVAYAAKGTWQIDAGHRLDASFFGDPAIGDIGPQRSTALLRTDTSGFSKLDSTAATTRPCATTA